MSSTTELSFDWLIIWFQRDFSAEHHFAASYSLPLWTPTPSRVYIANKIENISQSGSRSFNLIRDFLLGRSSFATTAADLSGWNWFRALCLQLQMSWSSISYSKMNHEHDFGHYPTFHSTPKEHTIWIYRLSALSPSLSAYLARNLFAFKHSTFTFRLPQIKRNDR